MTKIIIVAFNEFKIAEKGKEFQSTNQIKILPCLLLQLILKYLNIKSLELTGGDYWLCLLSIRNKNEEIPCGRTKWAWQVGAN